MSLRAAIDRGFANAEAETNYIRMVYVDHVKAELTPEVLSEALLKWLGENAGTYKGQKIVSDMASQFAYLERAL